MKCSKCDKELEFLPFGCKYCGKQFCKDHRLPEAHNCDGMALAKKVARGRVQSTKREISENPVEYPSIIPLEEENYKPIQNEHSLNYIDRIKNLSRELLGKEIPIIKRVKERPPESPEHFIFKNLLFNYLISLNEVILEDKCEKLLFGKIRPDIYFIGKNGKKIWGEVETSQDIGNTIKKIEYSTIYSDEYDLFVILLLKDVTSEHTLI